MKIWGKTLFTALQYDASQARKGLLFLLFQIAFVKLLQTLTSPLPLENCLQGDNGASVRITKSCQTKRQSPSLVAGVLAQWWTQDPLLFSPPIIIKWVTELRLMTVLIESIYCPSLLNGSVINLSPDKKKKKNWRKAVSLRPLGTQPSNH